MKLAFFLCFLNISSASAAIIETKFFVHTTFVNAQGKEKQLPKTRTYIRYNDNSSVLSSKKDCLITIGKEDAQSLWTTAESHGCVSSKDDFAVVDEDSMIDIFYRGTMFELFGDSLNEVYNLRVQGASVISKDGSPLQQTLVGLFSEATKLFKIPLKSTSTFELSAGSTQKFIIKITPVKSKLAE
ncbi:MAG: hypothetical protein ACOYL6_04015 [Bacteriovoracaceae bacterium]